MMTGRLGVWLVFLYAAMVTTYVPGQEGGQPKVSRPKLTLFVPAYSYPAGSGLRFWDELIAAADRVPIIAIANPASGPGDNRDENYSTVLKRAKRAGVRLIGYVSTDYGKRKTADVNLEVDRWTTLYPMIEGIFFDEQSSDRQQAAYYMALSTHARAKVPNAFIVSNPGTDCAEEYVAGQAFDVICIFESGRGYAGFQMPEWGMPAGRTQFAALPYGVAQADVAQRHLQQAVSKGISYIYVTHDALPNPWDELASYWKREVTAVREINAANPPSSSEVR
jgi:hypothetical protein